MVATCSNLWMDAGFDDPIKRPFKQNSVAYRMALRAYAAYRRDVYGEPASMAFDNADTAVRSHLARRREERKLYGWQGAISW